MNAAIEIKNLTIKFGTYAALENINVEIEEGSFVAIVGPNGSGKTTLLKTLLGLIKPTSGEINILGKPQKSISPEWFGYVPQIKTLDRSFPALPIELVASGIRRSWVGIISSKEKSMAIDALEQVGAGGLAYRQLNSLSGGELQRIYLARSLVRKPKILLLDEPATGIDMVCEANINQLIEDFNKNMKVTVVMVTHNWGTAKHHAKYSLLLNRTQVSYGPTSDTFSEINLSKAFRHIEQLQDINIRGINV
jgi:zinc transport system ATP-binding protein